MAKKKTGNKNNMENSPLEEDSKPSNNNNNNNNNIVDTATDDDDNKDEEEEMVYLQVDTGDMIKLKQVLDEAVAGSVLQSIRMDGTPSNQVNLPEDCKNDNIKLVIMSLACGFALLAQFAPFPFPESRVFIGLCCALYFLLSGILQYIITFLDKDTIFITKPLTKELTSEECIKKNPNLVKYGLRFRTSLPRFSEFYTVIIEYYGLEQSPFVKQVWSVGKFFDAQGMFDEVGIAEEIVKLYRRFENGQYDIAPDTVKTAVKGSEKVKTN